MTKDNNIIVRDSIVKPCITQICCPVFRDAVIFLNNVCNFNCYHCYVKKGSEEISVKLLSYLMSDCVPKFRIQRVTLVGGEPLLYSNLNALFQILNVEQGLEIIITTNGSVCSGELIELLKSINLKQLKISLHSLEPRTFSKFTGTVGQFGNVLRNIRKFAHIFNVGINITLTKSNYPELDRVIFFCKNEGVKSLHISQLTPSGQGTQIRAEKLSNDQIKEVADRLGKSSNDDLSISYDSHSSCGFGQKLVVGPSGDLYPCVALVSYPEYRIGDIYSTGIKLQRRINKFNEIRSKRCFVEEFIR